MQANCSGENENEVEKILWVEEEAQMHNRYEEGDDKEAINNLKSMPLTLRLSVIISTTITTVFTMYIIYFTVHLCTFSMYAIKITVRMFTINITVCLFIINITVHIFNITIIVFNSTDSSITPNSIKNVRNKPIRPQRLYAPGNIHHYHAPTLSYNILRCQPNWAENTEPKTMACDNNSSSSLHESDHNKSSWEVIRAPGVMVQGGIKNLISSNISDKIEHNLLHNTVQK